MDTLSIDAGDCHHVERSPSTIFEALCERVVFEASQVDSVLRLSGLRRSTTL